MKAHGKTLAKITVLAMAAGTLLTSLCACSSVKPVNTRQDVTFPGSELWITTVMEDGTEQRADLWPTSLSQLFHVTGEFKNLKKVSPSISCKYFYHRDEKGAGYGFGTADSLENAAFLALRLPEARRSHYAAKIRELAAKPDEHAAAKLYEAVRMEFPIRILCEWTYYNNDMAKPMTYSEYYLSSGESSWPVKVRHGLQRTFYPEGLMRSEYRCSDGAVTGRAVFYNKDGSLKFVATFRDNMPDGIFTSFKWIKTENEDEVVWTRATKTVKVSKDDCRVSYVDDENTIKTLIVSNGCAVGTVSDAKGKDISSKEVVPADFLGLTLEKKIEVAK